jgi:putative DNA primase/helicase
VASRHEVAVLAVTHLSKAEQKALMRVIGSIGFVAAARAGYLVAKDPERPERRLFLPMKNNIAADQTGLAFTIEGRTLPGGIEPSCVMWEAQPVTMTADEALAATAEVGEERSAVAEAKDFLGEILADGPVPSKQVKAEADSAGLMWPTVRRAQRVLGVVIAREGFGPGGVWTWRLPHRCSSDPIDAQAQEMSTYGRDEHLCRTAPGNGSSEPPQAAGEEPEAEPWEAEL